MVATSSMNHGIQDTGIRSRGRGNAGAIAAMVAAGSPVGQFYRQRDFQPPIGRFPGVGGITEAGHVALKVAKEAPEGSSASRLAQEFIAQYPNSRIVHPSSLKD